MIYKIKIEDNIEAENEAEALEQFQDNLNCYEDSCYEIENHIDDSEVDTQKIINILTIK